MIAFKRVTKYVLAVGIAIVLGLGCGSKESENRKVQTSLPSDLLREFIIDLREATDSIFYKEFKLSPVDTQIYAWKAYEDSISYLMIKSPQSNWEILDTLIGATNFSNYNHVPRLEIKDFNKDGFMDIVAIMLTNVNGNQWGKIFLWDNQENSLGKLKSVETIDYWEKGIWAAPEYNTKDSSITCYNMASVTGVYYESIYKLKGMKATPICKKEEDMGNLKTLKYIGDGDSWKLVEIVDTIENQ